MKTSNSTIEYSRVFSVNYQNLTWK